MDFYLFIFNNVYLIKLYIFNDEITKRKIELV